MKIAIYFNFLYFNLLGTQSLKNNRVIHDEKKMVKFFYQIDHHTRYYHSDFEENNNFLENKFKK